MATCKRQVEARGHLVSDYSYSFVDFALSGCITSWAETTEEGKSVCLYVRERNRKRRMTGDATTPMKISYAMNTFRLSAYYREQVVGKCLYKLQIKNMLI